MEIRKEFKFEMGHIVRNAWSRRCSKNAHGHSYTVEIFIESDSLDKGQMVMDFGLIKESAINDFLDSFDHSFMLWNTLSDKHIIDFFENEFERVIVSPYSSSAEAQAWLVYTVCKKILDKSESQNGERGCDISRVIVHETKTGKAEFNKNDYEKFEEYPINIVRFSKEIKQDWKNKEFLERILKNGR